MRLLWIALVSLAVLTGCHGLPESPIWLTPQLSISPAAFHYADSLYHASWQERTEKAACIQQWQVRPDGTVVVQKIVPATIEYSDSVNVISRCPAPLPVLHTHLIENGWRYTPSPTDSNTARKQPFPFQLMMSDSHVWTVLWKPKEK